MPPLSAIGSSLVFLFISIWQLFIPIKSNAPVVVPTGTQPDEWRSLFNGKDLRGWHTFGKTTVNPSWKVADGCIYFDAASKSAEERKGPGDLVSDEEFENFHLELEWKVCKNGNSGIIFWSKEENDRFKESWHTGPEMQVLDNDGHPDGKIPKHRAGNLYDLLASKEGVAKPYEQWNKAEIIADHGLLIFRLNNEEVLRTRYDDENWKAMIAGSKFKTKKDFGTFTKGHIVLQDHGDDVWYRNIRIKSH